MNRQLILRRSYLFDFLITHQTTSYMKGSAEQYFQILDHFMGKFNDPAIMLQPLSVFILLWNSQDFGSFHMSKFKQIQFGGLNQGTIGSAPLLLCVVMYLWIQLLTRSVMTTHKASSWESSRKKTLQLYHTFSFKVTVFLELHATFSIVTVAGWKLLAKEAEPLCAELLVSCGTALSTLAIQSNHKRWSFPPLKYSKVLQRSSHQPYPGRLQLTNNERACRGSNANNDGFTSDRFTPPSHHVTEEEVTTSNSCSVWEVHKNLYLIFLLYLQVPYKALLCSWPPR